MNKYEVVLTALSELLQQRKQQGSTHPFRSHWKRSLKAQVRFCTVSKTGWIIKTVIDNQQKLNCAFFVN